MAEVAAFRSPEDGFEAMEEDIEWDDQLESVGEREKYRRYRRRLPRNSLLARDLQFSGEEEPESPVDTVRKSPSIERKMSESPESQVAAKERLKKHLKVVKEEPEETADSGEFSFERFSASVDSWLHGFTSLPDLVQDFEGICRELAEALRDEASERHRVMEDRLLRQKAQLLHSEALTWALIWHLFGKGQEEMDFEVRLSSTSAQAARDFVKGDETAQACLRLVQWLETSASKELELEKKRKGWYAGSYLQNLGLWEQTKRAIRKNIGGNFVRHLDPDAPTREGAKIHQEDHKLQESLLEDAWKLIQAGRIEETQILFRTAGQAWRAASIGGCLMGYSPSVDSWNSAAKDRVLEAVELDSGLGRQRRLWKWACFCASEKIGSSDGGRYESAVFAIQCANVKQVLPVCSSWESACWALVRSWLDVQIEQELLSQQQVAAGSISGAETWPAPVLEQQPRDFVSLFQKLHSGNLVPENVRRSCKEHHRLVQMDLVLADIPGLLDSLKTWVLPGREDRDKPHGHPQLIRFAAHLVLVLRFILPEEARDRFSERLHLVGDLILNTYAIFLFTQHKEELVGAYASHLAPHLCIDLYVHMMELRQNDSEVVKRKIINSAMEYLPFLSEDDSKGSISLICDRFLKRSREIKAGLCHVKVEERGEYQRLVSLQKCQAVRWLCFEPPAGSSNAEQLKSEMLARALSHSVILFRELALLSLWRSERKPEAAHTLLGYIVEPLKENCAALFSLENHNGKEEYQEFLEWQEYFACDALYRTWLGVESFESPEEKDRSAAAAQKALDAAVELLQRSEGDWLSASDAAWEHEGIKWLQFSVTAALSAVSGPGLIPDPTICTALTSALYLCMGEAASTERQLTVNVAVNPQNEKFLDIGLRCTAVDGEGIGAHQAEDGGFLSAIMAAAIKGELHHFQSGVSLEVLRMDAWCIAGDETRQEAPFIVKGLCRRCCLPELILRCLQVQAWLKGVEVTTSDVDDDLIALVAARDGLYNLFSHSQLQELLLLEREIIVRGMEETGAVGIEQQDMLS